MIKFSRHNFRNTTKVINLRKDYPYIFKTLGESFLGKKYSVSMYHHPTDYLLIIKGKKCLPVKSGVDNTLIM
jgi:hypothetical protein